MLLCSSAARRHFHAFFSPNARIAEQLARKRRNVRGECVKFLSLVDTPEDLIHAGIEQIDQVQGDGFRHHRQA